jgi:hypothetical protein
MIDRMDDCDLDIEPSLDEFMNATLERFEMGLEQGARPKK